MKLLIGLLGAFTVILQYQLWLGEDSVRALNMLEEEVQAQQAINSELEARNRLLEIEVIDLKNGLEAVEERARSELGMIGEDEVFYLIIE
ncbi:MAG: septum formation initiator family protein [Pseudomonadales bacterium]|nr:septum formation initiator family protein [Pseudomonadales bacterium]